VTHSRANTARRVTARTLSVAIACGLAVQCHGPAALAAQPLRSHGSDHNTHNGSLYERVGNGKFNTNQTTVNSPVILRGIQHSANGVVNGNLAVQGAICKRKKWRNCRIIQKINQIFP
jgi:hypothetical protein